MKMSMEDRKIAMEMVQKLLNCGIIEAITNKKAKYGIYNWYRETTLRQDGISYADGATKAVFIDSVFNWVIKISLPGNDGDYCAREYENYCLATERGLDYYFAACDRLIEIDGITFYAQQYVECDEGVDSEIYEKIRPDSDNDVDTLWREVEEMEAWDRVMALYNDDALGQFIEERRINDLHCGNFGIAGDHYVMIDYSGWKVFSEEDK